MEAFDYLSVMVSIVIGVGLTQLFAGIGNFVQIRRRVRRYWLHSLWVLLLVAIHVQAWWSLWSLRAVDDWTFSAFAYVLAGPGILVIASHIVLPELVEGQIDAEVYYYDTHTLFFTLLAVVGAWAMWVEPMMGIGEWFVPLRLLQGAAVLTFVTCALTKSRRFHALAGVGVVALLALAISLTRFHLSEVSAPR